MIPEFGHFACILALVLALLQTVITFRGQTNISLQQSLLAKEVLCLLIAWLTLWYAFITNDFSVAVVYSHSHHQLPWWYKLSALWGGHEGSVLLWVLLLSCWRLGFARCSSMLANDRYLVNGVLAAISLGLMVFLLMSSNPFTRILPQIPGEGLDLNPLLQDPGMAWHPPILYLGYVAFAIPYACVLVMLWQKRIITDWAKHMRPWVLLAWAALTVGIVLGSWWAYRELGWGGWWFWDPVENASLLPWLGGVLLLHGLILVEKKQQAQVWTVLVALLTFILSLLGTFLVRSGVLISVHSFAQDPARGIWILTLIAGYGSSALLLFATRVHGLFVAHPVPLLNRTGLVLANQLVFAIILMTVLLGTLYPLAVEALGLGKISVGAPYFNQIVPMLALLLLLLLAVLPCLQWQHNRLVVEVKTLVYVLLTTVLMLASVWLLWDQHGHNFALLFAAICCFALAMQLVTMVRSALKNKITCKKLGMYCAHCGFLGMALSMSIAHSQSIESVVALAPGQSTAIAGYNITYAESETFNMEHYHGVRAKMVVSDGSQTWDYYPERRIYQVSKMNLAKTAIMIQPLHDIYMAMGEPLQGEAWSFRLQYKPMIRYIWLCALLMACGAVLAVAGSRRTKNAS